ncbi:hypothetical protein ACX80D_09865 [Arthrobacter sp. Sr24]
MREVPVDEGDVFRVVGAQFLREHLAVLPHDLLLGGGGAGGGGGLGVRRRGVSLGD